MPNQSADCALDQMFAALAHPARRAMVRRLTGGPASVSELAQPLAMSLPAVVQHLQLLEACGLVTSEKQGRVRTCRLDGAAIGQAQGWLDEQRARLEAQTDNLQKFLEEKRDLNG